MSSLDRLLQSSGVVVGEEPRRVFVHAGQVWVAREASEITTILGSCVAICVWDPAAGVGGMNHYMLPNDFGASFASPRYATFATNMLLEQLREAGADPARWRAKIFGGACILSTPGDAAHDLGAQNVAAARDRLRAHRIPIVDADTGGIHGRKVLYQTATGETTVTKVRRVIA